MRIDIALGGNALPKRGEHVNAQAQQDNIRLATGQLAKVADGNSLVIVHGNGPKVSSLAWQGTNAPRAESFSLDVLDAETQGMIAYTIELELCNLLTRRTPLRETADDSRGQRRRPGFHATGQTS